ncbi:MAG: hypothetical protein WBF53_00520 [Litorimonas sp.]
MTISEYALTLAEHEVTGRIVATCRDLPGFIAHGRDKEQLRERISNVLRRVLEREGHRVDSIDLIPAAPDLPDNIRIRSQDGLRAVATFAEAA